MNNVITPFIHHFKTANCYYVYDVNTNAILKLDEIVYKSLLYEKDIKHCNNEVQICIKALKSQGYLSSNRLKKIQHPDDDLIPFYLNSSLKSLTLQVTQMCNLRCSYCIYSGNFSNRTHSPRKMTLETALKAINFYIKRSTDEEKLNFGFYGGEPLLEFDFIKKVIEYIEKVCEGKEITYNLTTNATLLNEDIIYFFEKHNVNLMISIDGPKEIHDKNRLKADCSSSYNDVLKNIKIINKKFPSYAKKVMLNCVLDPRNNFGCISEFFANCEDVKDFYSNFSNISNEYIINDIYDVSEEYMQSYKYEVFKMFLSKINRLDKQYVSKIVELYYENIKQTMLNCRVVGLSRGEFGHHGGPCIAGAQRLFVDTEGNFYPCEKVSESSKVMQIGNLDKGFDIEKVRTLINIGKLTEEECKDCWASKFCYLCALFADDINGLSRERKLKYCKEVKENVEELLKDYCLLKELNYSEDEVAMYK